MRRPSVVEVGAGLAWALTAHTAWNLRRLRVPPTEPPPVTEPVSVLVPARDEAAQIAGCVRALLASTGVDHLEVLVLDDRSGDRTAEVARAAGGADPRLRVLEGAEPPPGWLGKPWACAQLARAARGRVLVFVDADVRVAPHAVAATVAVLRSVPLDLVSPYPRQLAESPAERLVQPLLQWSWLATLPLGPAERSARPSLGAANGQLLAVDAAAYAQAGGHAAVRGAVLEDLALLRAIKASGGHGTVIDGTGVATCRMYDGWPALRAGYTKSLWAAFGSPAGAAGVMGGLTLAYVVPPIAALRGSRAGALGYAGGVIGRVLVARRVGSRVWPDVLAHPASVATVGWLTVSALRSRRHGTLVWKGRPVGGP